MDALDTMLAVTVAYASCTNSQESSMCEHHCWQRLYQVWSFVCGAIPASCCILDWLAGQFDVKCTLPVTSGVWPARRYHDYESLHEMSKLSPVVFI